MPEPGLAALARLAVAPALAAVPGAALVRPTMPQNGLQLPHRSAGAANSGDRAKVAAPPRLPQRYDPEAVVSWRNTQRRLNACIEQAEDLAACPDGGTKDTTMLGMNLATILTADSAQDLLTWGTLEDANELISEISALLMSNLAYGESKGVREGMALDWAVLILTLLGENDAQLEIGDVAASIRRVQATWAHVAPWGG